MLSFDYQQYSPPIDYRTAPIKNMLMVTLINAISEAVGHPLIAGLFSPKAKSRGLTQTKKWFLSDEVYFNEKRGLSFMFICQALDLDSKAVRGFALSSKEIDRKHLTYFRERFIADVGVIKK